MNQKITFDHINETDLLGNYFEADSLYVGTREVAYQQFVNEFGGGQQGDQAQEGSFINNLISKYNSLGSFGKILLLSAGLVLTALVLGSLAIFASQYDGPYSKILGIREDSNQNSVNRDLSDSRNSNDKKVENYQDCLKYGSVVGSLCFYEDKTFGSDEEDKNGDLEPKDILDLEQEDFSTRPGSAVEGFNSDSDNSLNLQVDSNPGINRNFPDSPESNESKPRQNLPDGDQPPDQNGNNNDDDSGNQDDNPDDEPEETKTCYQFYGNFSLEVPASWTCYSPKERNVPSEQDMDPRLRKEYIRVEKGDNLIEIEYKFTGTYKTCTESDLINNTIKPYGSYGEYSYNYTQCDGYNFVYGLNESNLLYPKIFIKADDPKNPQIIEILNSLVFHRDYTQIDDDDNPDDEPEETKTCYQFYGNFSLEVPEDWKCESPEERNLPAEDITDSIDQREYLIATNGKDKIEVINTKNNIYEECTHEKLVSNMESGYGSAPLYYYIFTSCNENQLIYGYPKSNDYYYPRVYVQAEDFKENLIRTILKSFTFEEEYPEIKEDNPDDEQKETKTCYQFYGNFSLEVPEDWKCESPEERNLPAEDITDSIEQREYLIATNGKDKIEVINKKFDVRDKIYLSCSHRDLLKNRKKSFGGSKYYYKIVTECNGQRLIYGYGKKKYYSFYPRIFVQTEKDSDKTIKKILKSIDFHKDYPED